MVDSTTAEEGQAKDQGNIISTIRDAGQIKYYTDRCELSPLLRVVKHFGKNMNL